MGDEDIQQRFCSILNCLFQCVDWESKEEEAVYFYRPVDISAISESGNSSKVIVLDKILDIAKSPLFLKLHLLIVNYFPDVNPNDTKRNGVENVEFDGQVSKLPTSYTVLLNSKDSVIKDFTPAIGTPSSEIESSDGRRAMLKIICLGLPALSNGFGNRSEPTATDGLKDLDRTM